MQRRNQLLHSFQDRNRGTRKMFVALALLLPAFAMASKVMSWGLIKPTCKCAARSTVRVSDRRTRPGTQLETRKVRDK